MASGCFDRTSQDFYLRTSEKAIRIPRTTLSTSMTICLRNFVDLDNGHEGILKSDKLKTWSFRCYMLPKFSEQYPNVKFELTEVPSTS
jgi:hypothetical protein